MVALRAPAGAGRHGAPVAPSSRVLLPAADHEALVERLLPGVAVRDGATPGHPASRGMVAEVSAWIDGRLAEAGIDPGRPAPDLTVVGQALASAAWADMSVAFPLWCHRMVVEYLAGSDAGSRGSELLSAVRRGELIGSTALAPAIAHVVAGASLPVEWREAPGGDLIIDGRLRWASNLFPPDCVLVTAAAHADGGRPVLVAIPGDAAGLHVDAYPSILALGATGSSSVRLETVRVSGAQVLATDLHGFICAIRPPFLLLQSCFALGLTARAFDEAGEALARATSPATRVFSPDHANLCVEFDRVAAAVSRLLSVRGTGVPVRDVVALRLDAARLATDAVALEVRVGGGRAYLAASGTARRLREAAFLPVQAPTEGQLRWELSLSA